MGRKQSIHGEKDKDEVLVILATKPATKRSLQEF
jgi:hypothetical protein